MSKTAEEALALHRATGAALVAALEADAIGFVEVGPAAQLAAVVRSGRDLTTDQARRAWRILRRNEAALARAGIALPGGATATPAPVVVPAPERVGRPTLSLRSDGRIGVANHPFALKDALKVEAHAVWDSATSLRHSTVPGKRQWHAPATPASAAALVAILSSHGVVMSEGVERLVREYTRLPELRSVLDPTVPAPVFDTTGLVSGELWEHQFRAVAYVGSTSASLLAIPMGGGKTAAAIASVNRIRPRSGGLRVVIVCPNKVRGVWPHEVRKWSATSWHMVDGTRPSRRRGSPPQDLKVAERLEQLEACLFDCACGAAVHAGVLNYELLGMDPFVYRDAQHPGWSPPIRLDAVIYDEAHKLKSPTGQVSKTAGRWVDFFDRRIGLTGTPMAQYPWDIFGVYRALDPGIWGQLWTPFKAKHIEEKTTKDGRKFPAFIVKERRAEFARKALSIMYRPSVDLKLPGAIHAIRPVTLEPTAHKLYLSLQNEDFADLGSFTRVSTNRVEKDDAPSLTPKNVLAKTTRLRQFTGGTIPDDGEVQRTATGKTKVIRDRFRVSRAKAEELAQILDEVGCVSGVAEPEPVVVFCAFRDDLDVIREVAETAGLRYGEISGRRSDGLDSRAKLAEHVDVCGVQIDSGGTGIDLTRSAVGVWYSAGYSAGNHDQALARQDRNGQTRVVRFVHLVAVGTVDEDVYRSLSTRKSMVATFLRSHGVPLDLVGMADEDGADPTMSLDQIQDELNRQRATTPDDAGRTGGVRLPIDDFGADIFGDPRAHHRSATVVDLDKLREFDLEGFA